MKIAVLGAGSWGTALAVLSVRRGHETLLWARDPEVALRIQRERHHPRRFPDVSLPPELCAVSGPPNSDGADIVIVAVPSAAVRETLRALPPPRVEAVVVSAVKGFEIGTGKRVSEIAAEEIPGQPFVVLSGPTFAEGVMRGDPTAAVVASGDDGAARRLQGALSGASLRLYRSQDVVGVELCAGLKNVIAIAAGIVSGLGLGHNTLAALMTRGLAEIGRLVDARGGAEHTLLGLAGAGDLMLTCTGAASRNRRLGERIGSGEDPRRAMEASPEVAEGAFACLAASRLAEESRIELPIADAVRRILYDGLAPRTAIADLMTRELRTE